jgi:hypothetical protein
MMNLRTHARLLAAASVLALGIVGIPGTHAHAQAFRPRDTTTPCAYFNRQTGEWEFHLQGEFLYVKDGNGHTHQLQCAPGGYWIDTGNGFRVENTDIGVKLPVAGLSAAR